MKAAFIDFETTALNPKDGFVIEAAVIVAEFNDNLEITGVLEHYHSYNDPGIPIPEKITEITGITDEMVRWEKLDWEKIQNLLNDSDVIVAHNAEFDRKWAAYHGNITNENWVCSYRMVDWKKSFENSKLETIQKSMGINAQAHSAFEDVKSLIKVLRRKNQEGQTFFQEMLDNFNSGILNWAIKVSYNDKDIAKQHGFCWDGINKFWVRKISKKQWRSIKNELKPIIQQQWFLKK